MKNKIAAFAIITTALTASTSNLVAGGLTATQENTLVAQSDPHEERLTTTKAWPIEATSLTTDEFYKAIFGKASETTASRFYWSKTLKQFILDDAEAKITAAAFDEAKFQAKSLTEIGGVGEKIFVVYVGGTDRTSVTTAVDDTWFKMTGVKGTSESKTFGVNLAGQDTIDASTNTILVLKELNSDNSAKPDGDIIIIKNFLTTALDASGLATDFG